MMNLIDISSWQSGIDLPAMFAKNSLDGVIVKATQGVSYTNPNYPGWAKWLSDNGKPLGLYHYLDLSDPEKQAQYFYDATKAYVGKAIPIVDYEDMALSKGTTFLRQFLAKYYILTGVRCMIYCSLSVISSQDFSRLTMYPLWIAQYADNLPVNGFVDKPWQKGSVAPFERYNMHQYTSNGHLVGYSGSLDFDQFNGSFAEWCELCRVGGSSSTPVPQTPAQPKPADPSIVLEVLHGKYGTGQDRIKKLNDAGYDANDVQRKVNELYAVSLSCKRYIGDDNMPYLTAIDWILKCL